LEIQMNMSASTAAARASLPHPIVVFGRDDSGKAHASYFSSADGHMAKKAAGLMGMFALRADNDHVRSLIGRIPKGKLFSSGKAFVPFVKQDLFQQLADQLPAEDRQRLDEPRAAAANDAIPGDVGDLNSAAVPEKPSRLPEDWSKLKVGSIVLASEEPLEGWFEATIIEMKPNGGLRLKWRDYLDLPPFGRTVEQVALIHPNYVEG
jgi:hypothetical protein